MVGADGQAGDPADPEVLVRSAVRHLLSEPAPDPDHTNLWDGDDRTPAAVSVDITDSGTTVDLPSSAFGTSVGSEAASLAVSALVRTVVSNGGTAPVTVLVDGRAGAEAWGAVVLDEPLSPSAQDLASGWILDPYDGQRVAAGTVTLSGTATAFEGSVSWAVLDADGATVQQGATQSGSNGDYGPVERPRGARARVLHRGAAGREHGRPRRGTRALALGGDQGPSPSSRGRPPHVSLSSGSAARVRAGPA